MFAVVNIQGQQFKVAEGDAIFVHHINAEEGSGLAFDEVLLLDQEGDVTLGTPHVKGASVNATVLGHQKGDKVVVFKKKRRKGYKVKKGHRQHFTKLQIDKISI